ncbi:MAG: transposase, partial [Oscillospiraceae bacterium]|nr:transposase [Oscillospiraceae bacterium]
MQMKTGKCMETFDDNTAYRFLNNAKTNWEKFLFILSESIINGVIRNLTSENRIDAFIVDDSFYRKRGYKSSELVSWVFDHVAMKTQTGFRMLTLGWTDGATFIPIFGRLLASSKIEMIRGIV